MKTQAIFYAVLFLGFAVGRLVPSMPVVVPALLCVSTAMIYLIRLWRGEE